MNSRVPVRCRETGRVYPSIRAAAADVGIHFVNISVAVRRGYRAGGFTWERADENNPERPTVQHQNRPVRRNDGAIFPSVSAAAAALGISPKSIHQAMSRSRRFGHRRTHGWAFEFIEDAG